MAKENGTLRKHRSAVVVPDTPEGYDAIPVDPEEYETIREWPDRQRVKFVRHKYGDGFLARDLEKI